jgi:hypothetical protein
MIILRFIHFLKLKLMQEPFTMGRKHLVEQKLAEFIKVKCITIWLLG